MAAISGIRANTRKSTWRQPDQPGEFAVISNGRVICTDPARHIIQQRKVQAMNYPQFEDTIPTDFGGLTERRHYTPQSQRTGFLLCAACALAVVAIGLLIAVV